tara:strand:- start:229 stop:1152 length:924 start_codon:yes stop_codon:yes gene_type:complete
MTRSFKKVVKGDAFGGITAQDYNRSMEAAKRVLTGSRKDGTGGRRAPENRSIAYVLPPEDVSRVNNRAVLQLYKPTIEPEDDLSAFLNPIVWRTLKPQPRAVYVDGHHRTLAVTLKGMNYGIGNTRKTRQVVPAVISGLVQVRVKINDQDHDFVDAATDKETVDYMESQYDGRGQIVWREKPTETGEMWAVVNLDNTYTPRRQFVEFRLDEKLTVDDEFGRGHIYGNGIGQGVPWDLFGDTDGKKIHVQNLRRNHSYTGGAYMFTGAKDHRGLAYHNFGPNVQTGAEDRPGHPDSKFATFQIIQMEC